MTRAQHGVIDGRARISEMAQQVKVLAAKSDDLSLSLGTYLVEGRTDSCKLSSDLHHGTYIHTNRDACNTENYFKREGRWP